MSNNAIEAIFVVFQQWFKVFATSTIVYAHTPMRVECRRHVSTSLHDETAVVVVFVKVAGDTPACGVAA